MDKGKMCMCKGVCLNICVNESRSEGGMPTGWSRE